jgi:hypothetical protein
MNQNLAINLLPTATKCERLAPADTLDIRGYRLYETYLPLTSRTPERRLSFELATSEAKAINNVRETILEVLPDAPAADKVQCREHPINGDYVMCPHCECFTNTYPDFVTAEDQADFTGCCNVVAEGLDRIDPVLYFAQKMAIGAADYASKEADHTSKENHF